MIRIIELFSHLLNISRDSILECQIIGGMTNKNYLITTEMREKYVLRLSGENSNLLINRQYEFDNAKALLPLDISPDIVFYDVKNGYKITKYIENSQTLSPYSITKYIPEIADSLSKLHHSKIKFNNEFNFLKEYQKYKEIIIDKEIIIEPEFLNVEEPLLGLYDVILEKGLDLSPCHNDLVAENILIVDNSATPRHATPRHATPRHATPLNKLFFIDWEYSGINDPMWDLAALFLEANFTNKNENIFLSYYFGEIKEKDLMCNKQKIHIYKILQNQLWYLWTLIKEQAGDDFGNYKRNRLLSSQILYAEYIKEYL